MTGCTLLHQCLTQWGPRGAPFSERDCQVAFGRWQHFGSAMGTKWQRAGISHILNLLGRPLPGTHRPSLHAQLPAWLSVCCGDEHPVKAPSHSPGAQGLSLGTAETLDTQNPSSFWGAQLLTQRVIQSSATLPVKPEAGHSWASALPLHSKENTPVLSQNCGEFEQGDVGAALLWKQAES